MRMRRAAISDLSSQVLPGLLSYRQMESSRSGSRFPALIAGVDAASEFGGTIGCR